MFLVLFLVVWPSIHYRLGCVLRVLVIIISGQYHHHNFPKGDVQMVLTQQQQQTLDSEALMLSISNDKDHSSTWGTLPPSAHFSLCNMYVVFPPAAGRLFFLSYFNRNIIISFRYKHDEVFTILFGQMAKCRVMIVQPIFLHGKHPKKNENIEKNFLITRFI